jgi:hypothetical protein
VHGFVLQGEIMFNGPSMLYEVESLQKLYMKSATDPNDLRSVLELERKLNSYL